MQLIKVKTLTCRQTKNRWQLSSNYCKFFLNLKYKSKIVYRLTMLRTICLRIANTDWLIDFLLTYLLSCLLSQCKLEIQFKYLWQYTLTRSEAKWQYGPTPQCRGTRVPTFTNGWERTGALWVEEQQKRNWLKLYWHQRKRSPKRLIVLL